MQQFLLESPFSVGLCGGLIVLALGVWWTQSGARVAAALAAAAALITTGLVIVSLQIETEREQIRRTIAEVADALDNNNVPLAVSYIHAGAAAGLQRASQELPQYTFHEARVTRMHSIEVHPQLAPPAAIAEFNVAVEVEAGGQKIPVRRFVKVYFVKQGDRWLVRDYEHFDPLTGLNARE